MAVIRAVFANSKKIKNYPFSTAVLGPVLELKRKPHK
jgi:hypothetical protein